MTKPDAGMPGAPRGRTLAHLSEWPIRRKVALAVAAPLVLALLLTLFDAYRDVSAAREDEARVRDSHVLLPAVEYLDAVERAAVLSQTVPDETSPRREAAVTEINDKAAALRRLRDRGDLDPAVTSQIDDLLATSRAARDGSAFVDIGSAATQVESVNDRVYLIIDAMAAHSTTRDVRLTLLDLALQGNWQLSYQQMVVGDRTTLAEEPSEFYAAIGSESASLARLMALDPQSAGLGKMMAANSARLDTARLEGRVHVASSDHEPYQAYIVDLVTGIRSDLAATAAAETQRAWLKIALAALLLLVAFAVASLVAHQIIGAIRRIRDAARTVAFSTLPDELRVIHSGREVPTVEPVPVSTSEETGQLARAVDELHQQAVHLAAAESRARAQIADMFTTLSRRNTSLVNQQLGVIEALETDEQDPRRLESLFRLDHLASRMRRNAQSLVILADVPVKTDEQESLSVNDTIQAALAGVQDYTRVRPVGSPAHQVVSSAASGDVVHLLTELLDNALVFSPPTADVVVSTESLPDQIRITIRDAGLGMSAEHLDQANRELATGGRVTAETARRMGLFVVSRLARRHRIGVSLAANELGGVTATVSLPATVWRAAFDIRDPEPAMLAGPGPLPQAGSVPSGVPHGSPGRVPQGAVAAPRATNNGDGRPVEPERSPRMTPPVPASSGSYQPKHMTPPVPAEVSWAPSPPAAAGPVAMAPGPVTGHVGPDAQPPLGRHGVLVEDAHRPQRTTPLGLPIRTPGNQPMPGAAPGIEQRPAPVIRDPERIRAQLSAHAAGVSRGRRLSAAPTHPED